MAQVDVFGDDQQVEVAVGDDVGVAGGAADDAGVAQGHPGGDGEGTVAAERQAAQTLAEREIDEGGGRVGLDQGLAGLEEDDLDMLEGFVQVELEDFLPGALDALEGKALLVVVPIQVGRFQVAVALQVGGLLEGGHDVELGGVRDVQLAQPLLHQFDETRVVVGAFQQHLDFFGSLGTQLLIGVGALEALDDVDQEVVDGDSGVGDGADEGFVAAEGAAVEGDAQVARGGELAAGDVGLAGAEGQGELEQEHAVVAQAQGEGGAAGLAAEEDLVAAGGLLHGAALAQGVGAAQGAEGVDDVPDQFEGLRGGRRASR